MRSPQLAAHNFFDVGNWALTFLRFIFFFNPCISLCCSSLTAVEQSIFTALGLVVDCVIGDSGLVSSANDIRLGPGIEDQYLFFHFFVDYLLIENVEESMLSRPPIDFIDNAATMK